MMVGKMFVRIDVALSRQKILEVIRDAEDPITRDELADLVGCHPATVSRAVRDLQHAGQLRITQRGRGKYPNRYEVVDANR